MGELEDMIGSVLSDPEQMQKIQALANSLMGSGEKPEAPPESERGGETELLKKLGSLMGTARPGRQEGLLQAMGPYLSDKRRAKMARAMQIAKLARLAGFAFEELGGEDNDQTL